MRIHTEPSLLIIYEIWIRLVLIVCNTLSAPPCVLAPGTGPSRTEGLPKPVSGCQLPPLTDRAGSLCVDRHPLHHAKETDGTKEIGINKILKSLISLGLPTVATFVLKPEFSEG